MSEESLLICDHCGVVYKPKDEVYEKEPGDTFEELCYRCPNCKKLTSSFLQEQFHIED